MRRQDFSTLVSALAMAHQILTGNQQLVAMIMLTVSVPKLELATQIKRRPTTTSNITLKTFNSVYTDAVKCLQFAFSTI